MCTLDVFLLALPMFIMVGLSIHMFTRAPSPNFSPFPVDDDMIGPGYGTNRRKILAPASLEIGLMPKEPIWLSILLPVLPIIRDHSHIDVIIFNKNFDRPSPKLKRTKNGLSKSQPPGGRISN